MEKFRTSLEQSGATVKSATRTMREALKTFHRANPGEEIPEPEPEP